MKLLVTASLLWTCSLALNLTERKERMLQIPIFHIIKFSNTPCNVTNDNMMGKMQQYRDSLTVLVQEFATPAESARTSRGSPEETVPRASAGAASSGRTGGTR